MNVKADNLLRSAWLSPVVGGLLGMAFFLYVFGVQMLNPCHVEWILRSGDLAQHHLGWVFFRNGDWRFPLGLTDQMCFPYTASVVYTDSIPWLALIFKCFSAWLPQQFQYLGLYMLVCYVLQGALGALLVRRLTGNNGVACLGAVPFVLSPVLMFRAFVHVALCSHYIILLAFLLYLSDRKRPRLWPWCALMAWAAGVHFMFVPMVAVVMLGSAVREAIVCKKAGRPLLRFFTPCLVAGAAAWLMGGFSSEISSGGYCASNLGYYSMNLNAFFNCMSDNISLFVNHLPYALDGQWEGFAYCGMGVLVGAVLCVPLLHWKRNWLDYILVAGMAIVFVLLALSPTLTLNSHVLGEVPTLKVWSMLLGVFRSSGRFAWPVVYLMMTVAVVALWKGLRRPALRWSAVVLVVALQVADLGSWLLLENHRVESSALDLTPYEAQLEGKNRLCYCHLPQSVADEAGLLFVAADKKMKVNIFYFARRNGKLCRRIAEEAAYERDHDPQPATFYID